MAQTIGYLIAASGPVTVGALHDQGGGWFAPVAALLGCTATLLVVGWIAAADRRVEDDPARCGAEGRR